MRRRTLGVCLTAARICLSTFFWSAALSAGNSFFSAPSLKNSPSLPLRDDALSFEK